MTLSENSPTGHVYSLSDFQALIASARLTYTLPDSVMSVFSMIESNIEIPDFTATPAPPATYSAPKSSGKTYSSPSSFPGKQDARSMKGGHSRNAKGKMEVSSVEDWEMMRNFKTTVIEKKVGVEKTINEIRIKLNKITGVNYAKQSEAILAEVAQYIETADLENTPENTENVEKIARAIFTIASSNKFYSEVYADLYGKLMGQFSIFREILAKFVEEFGGTISTIEYADPEVDYDAFCRVNKANDQRKSTTTFVANLLKKGFVQRSDGIRILEIFLRAILQFMEEDGRIPVIEEITENVFVFVSACIAEFRDMEIWKEFLSPTIHRLSTVKPAECKSMSNRVVFKYMDMVSLLRKASA